jgi:hypothetical protein
MKAYFYLLTILLLSMHPSLCLAGSNPTGTAEPRHVKVYYEQDKYGGWPANWGIWNWGDEILVGFTCADHKDVKEGHSFDQQSSLAKFARSRDGGLTWKMEDAFESGISEATVEHRIGGKSVPAKVLTERMDFSDPNFALTFRMVDMITGPSSFYYSCDRGKSWKGAYRLEVKFPDPAPAGIVTRTDYLVEGKHVMTAFLTVGFVDGNSKWREVACVRTTDGGLSWNFLSWVGPHGINSIMPASARLDASRILCVIRRTNPPGMVSFLSSDNGKSWEQRVNPAVVDANGNPPALLKLKDGRLCLVYGIRESATMKDGIGMYVTYSGDDGTSWSNPVLLRGKDGAYWDIGYPRSVLLPNGRVVAVYYYNNLFQGDQYRYIAATIFEPGDR